MYRGSGVRDGAGAFLRAGTVAVGECRACTTLLMQTAAGPVRWGSMLPVKKFKRGGETIAGGTAGDRQAENGEGSEKERRREAGEERRIVIRRKTNSRWDRRYRRAGRPKESGAGERFLKTVSKEVRKDSAKELTERGPVTFWKLFTAGVAV